MKRALRLLSALALTACATCSPDQIRIEIETLTSPVVEAPKVCKSPTLFGNAVLPTIRTTVAANGTCN